ncbi:hypothetical protein Goshw_018354, partial [Gossypium schwendimanii]|nr:hypothetical protein [Gossypium schwendimanii]
MDITRILPEECLCLIISLTSPVDACGSAMVSHALRSVADCDAVWEKFLPSDYKSIISGSSSSSLLCRGKEGSRFSSLFPSHSHSKWYHAPCLYWCFKQSFQLKKESGKKCYMLGARALSIIWGDTPSTWKSLPESSIATVSNLTTTAVFTLTA